MIRFHKKLVRNIPRPKRFVNLPGGPTRKFSLYKRFYYFILRLFHLPLLSTLPDNFIIPSQEARKLYDSYGNLDTLTWLGHSTFLIKLNGKTILTDPFLTDYASPFSFIGPKRYTPPGIQIEDLPPIDIVLVSHDHYDHCDAHTLDKLSNKENTDVVAPLNLGYLFEDLGYKKIHELNRYESCSLYGITIHALPAYHYSKRHLLNRNTSLWLGFSLVTKDRKIYFSGDTAYGSVFAELGLNYGPFDYALVSIGAYEPAHFMLASHLSPEQAVQLGTDIQAKTLVAMHWGTIILSDEPHLEPPLRFYHAGQEANYTYPDIWILNIGETKKL